VREDQRRAPNWKKWRHIPCTEVWRAVALSLDIDPDRVKINRHSWMGDGLVFDESQEFQDRVFVAGQNLGNSLTAQTLVMGRREACTISVPEFAGWAMSIGWGIPQDLAALASSKGGGVPDKKPTGELDGKSRATLLKMILGMAIDGYGYDPRAARSPIPKQIADALLLLGLSITDETVRDWLKTAMHELEWDPATLAD
jgi:hypothetical protein